MVIGQVLKTEDSSTNFIILQFFNLHHSAVCPHPSSDQSGEAEHPLDWGSERSQQGLLLCSHCQHTESDNGELSSKNIVDIKNASRPT